MQEWTIWENNMINEITATTEISTGGGFIATKIYKDKDYSFDKVKEILGLIPQFLQDGDPFEHGFKTALGGQYGMPLHEMEGGTVDDNGNYLYPSHTTLHPLASYETVEQICYQYHDGIIAILSKDDSKPNFVTRMD